MNASTGSTSNSRARLAPAPCTKAATLESTRSSSSRSFLPHPGVPGWSGDTAAVRRDPTSFPSGSPAESFRRSLLLLLLLLGSWVQSRRAEYKRDLNRTLRLWPELAALPFEWQQRTDLWDQGLAALEQYRRDYGDTRVPHWFETTDGIHLGKWLDTRRTEYRAGGLDAERIAALEAQGVQWSLRIVTDTVAREAREDAHFRAMLIASTRWVREHDGLLPVERELDSEGLAIGRWSGRVRRQLLRGRIPDRRLLLIEEEMPPTLAGV
ncbi:helicase associated domain-containing protein [Curtobacterium sp. VKM Ac-1395]|uniref:helicase associated domain-containing protein n=1 Tax=Curtobacterium sp. VKM Ac-1395 TaxID=2783815 RepID=UPI003A5C41F2